MSLSPHPPPDVLPPASPPAAPALAPRVDSLDLLRGIAILGIFLMNTQSILLPQSAYVNPSLFGDFSGRHVAAYLFTHLFADMKFITIFSFLFGAGILLQGERAATRGLSPARIHYSRMLILLAFGLFHAFVIWYGDILTTYALCGLLFYPLKRLPGVCLVALGLLMILFQIPINNAIMTDRYHFFPLEQIQNYHYRLTENMSDSAEVIAYTGPIAGEFAYRARMALDGQTTVFLNWALWRCGGCILIGMGLHRWRFFHGEWPRSAYQALALFGILPGWAFTALGILYNHEKEWENYALWTFGVYFNYLGSLLTALGYMALGVLLARWAARAPILSTALTPIRAVGKTALSNYIFQSVVGTLLAYAHILTIGGAQIHLGFGWMGKVSRAGLLPIVLATWAAQLVLSVLWLRHFRQGPLEWLWHKLVYLGRPSPAQPPLPATAP